MSLVVFAEFVAGYLLILATPGPNMFAVAGIASVRGIRAAAPLCFGLALGGGVLCASIALATHAEFRPDRITRLATVGLLIWVGSGILRGRARERVQTRSQAMVACGAGFATAVANPITAAYFLSAAIDAGGGTVSQIVVPITVMLTACGFYLLVASVLGTPAARRVALRWDRPIRIAATVVIALMAMRLVWPLLVG